jgi:hypothetical protein
MAAKEKIVLYTLAVNNYCPEMTAITFPLMEYYADKIGAEFVVIRDRKWPDLPPVMEKFQVHEMAQKNGADWHIYLDADTLVHPDFFDITALLTKDTTCSGISSDFTPMRFAPDEYFRRDGRFIGKGNWCAVFSNWCLDYYQPPDPMTKDHIMELARNIRLTTAEGLSGVMENHHLIDDYLVSRNLARYGLKHTLIGELAMKINRPDIPAMLWHQYLHDAEKKVEMMKQLLTTPPLPPPQQGGWGIGIPAPRVVVAEEVAIETPA